jgi:HTH-type transcriptional regulator/antitoxin HigA
VKKATLIIIQNQADHEAAKALVSKLMQSNEAADRARMVAQARLIEAYECARWPRKAPPLPDLLTYLVEQHGLTFADLVRLLGTASRVSEVMSGKRELKHDDGEASARTFPYSGGFADFGEWRCCGLGG